MEYTTAGTSVYRYAALEAACNGQRPDIDLLPGGRKCFAPLISSCWRAEIAPRSRRDRAEMYNLLLASFHTCALTGVRSPRSDP